MHFKCSASCSPREAIGDIDNIEKDDTAKENINIEERGAYSILVGATQLKETVPNKNPKIRSNIRENNEASEIDD